MPVLGDHYPDNIQLLPDNIYFLTSRETAGFRSSAAELAQITGSLVKSVQSSLLVLFSILFGLIQIDTLIGDLLGNHVRNLPKIYGGTPGYYELKCRFHHQLINQIGSMRTRCTNYVLTYSCSTTFPTPMGLTHHNSEITHKSPTGATLSDG